MDVSLTDLVAAQNDVGSGYRQTAIDALRAKGVSPEQITGDMLQQMIQEIAGPVPAAGGIDRAMNSTMGTAPPPLTAEDVAYGQQRGGRYEEVPPAPMTKPANVTAAPNADPRVSSIYQQAKDSGMLDALLSVAEQEMQGSGNVDVPAPPAQPAQPTAASSGNGIGPGALAAGGGAAALLAAIAAALSPGGRRTMARMVGDTRMPTSAPDVLGPPATMRSSAPTSAPTASSRPGPREAVPADIDYTQNPLYQQLLAQQRMSREFDQGLPAITGPQTRAARRQEGQRKFNEQRRAGK